MYAKKVASHHLPRVFLDLKSLIENSTLNTIYVSARSFFKFFSSVSFAVNIIFRLDSDYFLRVEFLMTPLFRAIDALKTK